MFNIIIIMITNLEFMIYYENGREVVSAMRNARLLTDKRRIHLRSASVRTYTFFTTAFPRFLSIRGARGLQAFDLLLLTNYLNPIYD
jgi:hypothetical protein